MGIWPEPGFKHCTNLKRGRVISLPRELQR